ncbi:NAD(P)/FAD-dependent oxidoreductase [Caulobacter sp. NIBR2454]|uniref:NAD(P)/FAD-dependent oxidoreductase n=1 Tax=Caulobacter sp. NIBR2454 TaxID=3015996 RepID=UPI0022B63935|nr:FAD-dependent oxidoreductase [Caulobacter sp. NIBR2454]
MNQRVVIAGGGAVGITAAATLARRGADVVLCDSASLGDNASGVAAGMLAPAMETIFDPASQGHFSILEAARAEWSAFAEAFGVTLERSGAVAVGDPDRLAAWEARLVEEGARFERLIPFQAKALSPELAEDLGALHAPDDLRLRAGDALRVLRDAAVAAGAHLVSEDVIEWSPGRARLAGGDSIEADVLLVATGAAREMQVLAPELSAVTPIKGHIALTRDAMMDGPVVRGDGVYICPTPAGVLVGATMEVGLSDRRVDPEIIAGLTARAALLLPTLRGARFEAAAAVRGATPDGLPLLGWSQTPGMMLAVGARRNGWLLAPLMANMINAYLSDKDAGPFASRFDPQRFRGPAA